MLVQIKDMHGNIELINPVNVTKAYSLKSGDLRICLLDGTYTITKMSPNELQDLFTE